MIQVAIAVVIVVVVGAAAMVLRRRQRPDAPTQPSFGVPEQIDRDDFVSSHGSDSVPWLVVIFTSASCHACSDVVSKARVLESRQVLVRDVEFSAQRELHRKYGVDAVPTLLIVNDQGSVMRSILGPVSATDLWAAVADARDPSRASEPRQCANHGEHDHSPA